MSSITMSTSSSTASSSSSSDCNTPKQQQHRKRTRATAEQLAVLEDTFAINVSPNAKLRKQLSERLHMSERSIQIWFQNRRAKVKHMQKRAQLQMQQAAIRAQVYQQQLWQHLSIMPSSDSRSPVYPTMIRAQSAGAIQNSNPQQPHPFLLQQRHESMPPYKTSPTHTCLSSPSSINTNDLFILSATTLVIGTWQRLALHATDLMCTFSQNAFQWHICDGGLQFKIHIPLESIRAIEHSQDDAAVHIDLLEAPLFYMLADKVWTQCSDFSESRQGSTYLRHTIKGAAENLRQDLLTLVNMAPSSISPLVRFIDLNMTCTNTSVAGAMTCADPSALMNPMASFMPSFAPDYWPSVAGTATAAVTAVGGVGDFFLS